MNKKILIISPQAWGPMYVSKHHYALELSRDSKVYFLNPPNVESRQEIIQINDNLMVINYQIPKIIWEFLKFHIPIFYDFYIKFKFRTLFKRLNVLFNEVWCFDPNLLIDFNQIPHESKLLFLADSANSIRNIKLATNVNLLISVSPIILENYKLVKTPQLLINHGLSSDFIERSGITLKQSNSRVNKVAYVGNLLIPIMNCEVIEKIVLKNPNIIFEFFGAFEKKGNNFNTIIDPKRKYDLQRLMKLDNTIFHGPILSSLLPDMLKQIDAFIICYDISRDQNQGADSHKILEYLSTGKIIISTHFDNYKNLDLFPMLSNSRTEGLVTLFDKVIANSSYYNSIEMQKKRINYALQRTYKANIVKIHDALNQIIDNA